MKLIHISDLHLGKRINEFSMLEDQRYILEQIVKICVEEHADALLLAGDIYDRPIPPAEAVTMLDCFFNALVSQKIQVCAVSGNHDSAERIAFGAGLMKQSGVHLSSVYDGSTQKIILTDEFGEVLVYLLPFVRPSIVRHALGQEEIQTYQDAVSAAVRHMEIDPSKRNILVAHQFVTGAGRCDSEDIMVGGVDNVDASIFEEFDYTALGHIHSPQNVGKWKDVANEVVNRQTMQKVNTAMNTAVSKAKNKAANRVRYCGTPLKYSVSEAKQEKSVTVIEMGKKEDVVIRTIPLIPKHDLRTIHGSYMEVTARTFYQGTNTDDYVEITLTDEEDIPDGMQKLRTIYPNLLSLTYDNQRTRTQQTIEPQEATQQKTEQELFEELYEKQNNQPMSEEQQRFVKELFARLEEETV